MNTSYNWIKSYVPDLDVSYQDYMDGMTLSGTKVENFKALDADLEKIVVGRVVSIEQHPDADKLVVCKVDIGEVEPLQIVTGAPNVFENALVPVVLDGGRVAGGHDGKMTEGGIRIKSGKLRGVPSDGMMCSIEELGQTKELYPEAPDNGLYIFAEGTVKPGDDAIEALSLHDAVFEYEVTSNRVDCYSVVGIAREVAATFRKEFFAPKIKVEATDKYGDVNDYIKVTVEAEDLCPRFCTRVIKNVKLGPSPEWMQRRLAVNGIRPINNLVDITNYVMEEYGQPLHAYDLSTIEKNEIIVRRAKQDETFVTLDGQNRKLDEEVLMICDGVKPVGLAGIMGGENSMITDNVKDVLLEAACFDGTNIRKSAKRVGLRTDASGKFEKGLDPNNAESAINRACQLIEELGCGEIVTGMTDYYPVKREPVEVPFEPERINALLGTALSAEEQLAYLDKVELAYDSKKNVIVAPTFRQDIFRTADLAEEVARFFGYDNIPTTLPRGEATTGKLSYKLRIEEIARNVVEFCGFSQGMSYSFESPKVFDKLRLPADSFYRRAIVISNPLGEDFSIMRTLPLNGMLTSLATNYNRRNRDVRLYELGNVYLPDSLPLAELPEERMQLTLGMYGRDSDFFHMKGVVEDIFEKAGITGHIDYDPSEPFTFLHPGRQARIICGHTCMGYLGELHPEVAKAYDIGERTMIAVLDMPEITAASSFDRKFEGIARFPAVSRDISMVMPKEMMVSEVEQVIRKKGGRYLEDYDLFDLYEGDQIEKGFKSVAYSIRFRAKDRTLADQDVNEAMERIFKGLSALGIELRK